MENYNVLERYNLILIRYSGEIWLKSMKVRIRMIKNLINNIKKHLNRYDILFHKYQLSEDSSRIFFFFKNQDISNAIKVLKDIFGIYSISPALRTSNELKNIVERTIEVGKDIFKENDTFAINVKRSGKQEY
ncbi:MAG TPA: THUMP domain-containing protein, partial [Candidatus Lokiarchaeia archaeon]